MIMAHVSRKVIETAVATPSFLLLMLSILFAGRVQAQATQDSLQYKTLFEIKIKAQRSNITRLQPVSGAYLWSGKKSEVIKLESMDANIAERTPRQIFAKVPAFLFTTWMARATKPISAPEDLIRTAVGSSTSGPTA